MSPICSLNLIDVLLLLFLLFLLPSRSYSYRYWDNFEVATVALNLRRERLKFFFVLYQYRGHYYFLLILRFYNPLIKSTDAHANQLEMREICSLGKREPLSSACYVFSKSAGHLDGRTAWQTVPVKLGEQEKEEELSSAVGNNNKNRSSSSSNSLGMLGMNWLARSFYFLRKHFFLSFPGRKRRRDKKEQ